MSGVYAMWVVYAPGDSEDLYSAICWWTDPDTGTRGPTGDHMEAREIRFMRRIFEGMGLVRRDRAPEEASNVVEVWE